MISREAYFGRYIVYGDREGFFHMLRDAGRRHDAGVIEKLCAAKHAFFTEKLSEFADPLPGVTETLEWLEAHECAAGDLFGGATRGD